MYAFFSHEINTRERYLFYLNAHFFTVRAFVYLYILGVSVMSKYRNIFIILCNSKIKKRGFEAGLLRKLV